jgi:hypothetical protein
VSEHPVASDPATLPFRVDSLREAYAWVDANPSASGPWTIASEQRSSSAAGILTMGLTAPDGDGATVRFETGHFGASGGRQRLGVDPTQALDELMAKVAEYAAANPPHHPGSLPRFPVPSPRYAGAVEVPLAILATDDAGRPGLFAPAKVVVVRLEDGQPIGIGDYPGFDPEVWPPARLGDWPPSGTTGMSRPRLAATVARFNGVWLRLLEAAVASTTYPQIHAERDEAARLLAALELDGMSRIYRTLNPAFWSTLGGRDV